MSVNYYMKSIDFSAESIKLHGDKVLLRGLLPADLGQRVATLESVTQYENALVHEVVNSGPDANIAPGTHCLVLKNALDKASSAGQYVFCLQEDIYASWDADQYEKEVSK